MQETSFPVGLMSKVLTLALKCASTDERRAYMAGVCIRPVDQHLAIESTDGHRLLRVYFTGTAVPKAVKKGADSRLGVFLNTPEAQMLALQLKTDAKNFDALPFSCGRDSLTLGNREWTSTTPSEAFPPTDHVIPPRDDSKKCACVVGFDPRYMDVLQGLAQFARGKPVRMQVGKDASSAIRFDLTRSLPLDGKPQPESKKRARPETDMHATYILMPARL